MKRFLIGIFLLFYHLTIAQSFQDFVNNVTSTAPPLRQTKVDSFMQANPQLPYTEFDTVANYVLTGNFSSVELAGDINGWQTGVDALTNIPSTNFWYLTHCYPANARLDYKFVTNGSNWILDPNNPNQVSGGFGPNSELAMPQYVQPWEIEDYPNVPKGSLITTQLYSSGLSKNFQIKVYLPPNYDSTSSYPVAYFHDGYEYISLASANHILDNLIDSNLIEPLIGVFVKPNNRNDEYAMAQRFDYRDFFVDDLVPWVDNNWSTRPDSSNRATIGASFGGNISAIIAYSRPDVFYKTGQHSGAFWPNNYETANLVASSQNIDLEMASVWGAYEGGLTQMWRVFQDSMTFYNIPNKYFQEYPEGHSWGLWRATLDELLIQLFPHQGISVPEYVMQGDISIYPNPTNDYLLVDGELGNQATYIIYDVMGRVMITGMLNDKRIDVSSLNPGIYILEVRGKRRNAGLRFMVE
jgi:enterochelin esterase-like enzyme